MMMMRVLFLSYSPCLTALFLASQGAEERLGGLGNYLCPDGKDGCLEKGDVAACEKAVKDPKRALCFASGGLNPNIKGDKDHYEEPAWKNFPKGGQPRSKLLDFHVRLKAQACMYCPAVGYWPEAEKSMMLACEPTGEKSDPLLSHCVATGVLLNQDAVLYRPPDGGVRMYKTYMLGKPWKDKLTEGTLDKTALMQGAFGASEFQDIAVDAEKFGTVFNSSSCDTSAQQFCFALDEASQIFCNELCRPVQTKCEAVSGVSGKDQAVRGLPCDVQCKVVDGKCGPRKTGRDIPKGPELLTDDRAKLRAAVRKAIEDKRQKGNARARARSLGRRLLRWLRGRARLAQ